MFDRDVNQHFVHYFVNYSLLYILMVELSQIAAHNNTSHAPFYFFKSLSRMHLTSHYWYSLLTFHIILLNSLLHFQSFLKSTRQKDFHMLWITRCETSWQDEEETRWLPLVFGESHLSLKWEKESLTPTDTGVLSQMVRNYGGFTNIFSGRATGFTGQQNFLTWTSS